MADLLQTTKCDDFGNVLLKVLMSNRNAVLFTTNEMLAALLSEPTEVSEPIRAIMSAGCIVK